MVRFRRLTLHRQGKATTSVVRRLILEERAADLDGFVVDEMLHATPKPTKAKKAATAAIQVQTGGLTYRTHDGVPFRLDGVLIRVLLVA